MESAVKYGQEHGPNLIKIAKRLLKNQNLIKLLVNTDKSPLAHPDITNPYGEILNHYIKVVPLLLNEDMTTKSKVVIFFDSGIVNQSNPDHENVSLLINIYCPFKEWLIEGDTIRPLAIMSEIRKSLQDKKLNGLGEITFDSFDLVTLSEEMGCYSMKFVIHDFA